MQYDFTTWRPRWGRGAAKYEMAKRLGTGEDTLPLTIADMEFVSPPEIVQAMEEAARFGMYGYVEADESFKKAVCGWMERHQSWRAKEEDLIALPGIVEAAHAAVRAFTQEGEGVLVQSPNYPPFLTVAKKNGEKTLNKYPNK